MKDSGGTIFVILFWGVLLFFAFRGCDGSSSYSSKDNYDQYDDRGRGADYDRSHYRSRGRRR